MKTRIVVLTAVVILINIVLLSLFALSPLKVTVSCLVLLMTGLSLYFLISARFKPAFRYGIGVLLPFMGIIEYVVALIMPPTFAGNWGVVIVSLFWLFQCLLLFAAGYVSARVR